MQRVLCRRLLSSARKTHYDILGVARDASASDLKKAFFQLSKKYHPDIAGNDAAAHSKFVEIKEAYDTLRDDQKRAYYDSQVFGGHHGGFEPHGSPFYQQRYPPPGSAGGDPFGPFQQQTWKSKDGWTYTYVRRGGPRPGQGPPGAQFSQEEFERIWKQFERMMNDPYKSRYDNEQRRRAQQAYDSYTQRRNQFWEQRAEEHARKYPFDNFRSATDNVFSRVNWERFNKFLLFYIVVFAAVGFYQAITGPRERKQASVYNPSITPETIGPPNPPPPPGLYSRPPPVTQPPIEDDPVRPYGFPETTSTQK